jgi:hypothetical protein
MIRPSLEVHRHDTEELQNSFLREIEKVCWRFALDYYHGDEDWAFRLHENMALHLIPAASDAIKATPVHPDSPRGRGEA